MYKLVYIFNLYILFILAYYYRFKIYASCKVIHIIFNMFYILENFKSVFFFFSYAINVFEFANFFREYYKIINLIYFASCDDRIHNIQNVLLNIKIFGFSLREKQLKIIY